MFAKQKHDISYKIYKIIMVDSREIMVSVSMKVLYVLFIS